MGWVIVRRIIKQNTFWVHSTYDDVGGHAAVNLLSSAARYITSSEPMFGHHQQEFRDEGTRRMAVVVLLGVGSNEPQDELYLVPADVEPYNDEAMHVEEWQFTAAELLAPHGCRLDDQFMAIVSQPDADYEVEVRRNGIATGHFIGMSDFAKGSAEHLRHFAEQQGNYWKKTPYGNVTTWTHKVVVDKHGKFLCFVQKPEGAEPSNELSEAKARLGAYIGILTRTGVSKKDIIATMNDEFAKVAEQVEKGLCHIGDIDPDTGSSRKRV